VKWKVINFVATTKHKAWVMWYILKACAALLKRGVWHDLSKYSRAEAPYFERAFPLLRELEYGSDEYKEALGALGPALQHHYANNSHHPEHYGNAGVYSMSPFDLVEMLCDWRAAGRRHKTGNMAQSLKINRERFGIEALKFRQLVAAAKEIGLL
jgi:hypothetical protein